MLADPKYQWLQMFIFVHSSLFMLVFETYAEPFDSVYQNRIEILNETNILIVSYLSMQLLYSSWSPMMLVQDGGTLNKTIIGGILINMVLVIYNMIHDLKIKCLTKRKKMVMAKRYKKAQKEREAKYGKGSSKNNKLLAKMEAQLIKSYAEQLAQSTLAKSVAKSVLKKAEVHIKEEPSDVESDYFQIDSNNKSMRRNIICETHNVDEELKEIDSDRNQLLRTTETPLITKVKKSPWPDLEDISFDDNEEEKLGQDEELQ